MSESEDSESGGPLAVIVSAIGGGLGFLFLIFTQEILQLLTDLIFYILAGAVSFIFSYYGTKAIFNQRSISSPLKRFFIIQNGAALSFGIIFLFNAEGDAVASSFYYYLIDGGMLLALMTWLRLGPGRAPLVAVVLHQSLLLIMNGYMLLYDPEVTGEGSYLFFMMVALRMIALVYLIAGIMSFSRNYRFANA